MSKRKRIADLERRVKELEDRPATIVFVPQYINSGFIVNPYLPLQPLPTIEPFPQMFPPWEVTCKS